MFGFQTWLIVAVVLSVATLWYAWRRMQGRNWVYRLLTGIGVLSLIWGVLPALGGGSLNQYLVIGAVIAFGFLVLSDSTGDGTRW